jgi:hypothetical protein
LVTKRGNGAKFGAATFDVAPKTNSNTNVLTIIGNDESNVKDTAIFVLYEKFNGTLNHDPTLSLERDVAAFFDEQTLIVIAMLLIIGVIMAVTIVIATIISVVVVASRNNQYQSV